MTYEGKIVVFQVLMKCNFCDEKTLNWEGATIYVKPTAETTISLSQIEVGSSFALTFLRGLTSFLRA